MTRLLIALNVVVFIMWHMTGASHSTFMIHNFLVSWQTLEDGRYWTLLTAVFSQIAVWHILINMFVLYTFGRVLEKVLGPILFLAVFLVCGVISSYAFAWTSNFMLHQPQLAALGASGAIMGVVLVFALMYPRWRLYILGLIPVPALPGALAFMGLDVAGFIWQIHGGDFIPIAHAAHIGGAITGILFYYVYIRPRMNDGLYKGRGLRQGPRIIPTKYRRVEPN